MEFRLNTPVACYIGCVLSWATAGTKTRRVNHARGDGAKCAMHHCLVFTSSTASARSWVTQLLVTEVGHPEANVDV